MRFTGLCRSIFAIVPSMMSAPARLMMAVLVIAITVTAPAYGRDAPAIGPETVLFNGKVVTVNEAFDVVEALAIRGDRIIAVGSDEEVLALAGPATRRVDLQGRTVIPGLIDGHNHLLKNAVDQYLGVDVTLAPSIKEMVARIGAKVADTPPGQLVYTTSGWLRAQLAEQRMPMRHDLDAVSPDNPVIVQSGHSYIVNSYVLRAAGITKETPSPDGGVIVKDAEGEPTGVLAENAMSLVKQVVIDGKTVRWMPVHATFEDKLEALRRAMVKSSAVGLTGVREPGISPADMRVYQRLLEEGGLTMRVSMNLSLDPHKSADALIDELEGWGVTSRFGNDMLRLDGIGEFGIDGGFEGALMSQPYAHFGDPDHGADYRGLQRIPTQKFTAVMEAMSRLGWTASVHVVGDRGMDVVLDAYEAANRVAPVSEKRWILEHGHYTRPDQFARIRDMGLMISAQFHPYMAGQQMQYYWGDARAEKSMRLRDWLDAGLMVGGGTDWSLLPANPFWVLYFWVTRDTRLGGVIGADQAVSREEALRVMTVNNAYLTMEEGIKGSLEPGKLADLVILSEDYLTVPDARLREITPLATIMGGRVVYEAAKSPLVIQ